MKVPFDAIQISLYEIDFHFCWATVLYFDICEFVLLLIIPEIRVSLVHSLYSLFQSFLVWRFPSKAKPEQESSPWSEQATDEMINQVHKRLCQSTYQSDYLGIPQGKTANLLINWYKGRYACRSSFTNSS